MTKYQRNALGGLDIIRDEDDASVDPKHPSVTNRLFVYGIFLGEHNRTAFNMKNPQYATVPGYITVGDHIVQAVPVNAPGIALTGLTVDADPEEWKRLDQLEAGYDRAVVKTSSGEQVFMYVRPERKVA